MPKGVFVDQEHDAEYVRVDVPDPVQRDELTGKLLALSETNWDVRPDTSGRRPALRVKVEVARRAGLFDTTKPKPRRGRPPKK